MKGSDRPARRPRPKLARRLRALHRWLGLGAALFLLLLCVTGVALNHSAALGLDTRFVGQAWLLDWYGIRGPALGPSFAAGERRITRVDDGLYLDDRPIELAGFGTLVGAARIGGELVVAAPAELVMLNGAGDIVERSPVGQSLPAAVDAIAPLDGALALRSAGAAFIYEPTTASVRELPLSVSEPAWAEPTDLPADLRESIEVGFRGRGLSVERMLIDLHSGRLFGLSGAVVSDVTAVALCLLAISGLVLFFRR